MAAEIILANHLPEGWNRYLDKGGREVAERFSLEVGDFTCLLKETVGCRWRFNELTKKIELDGAPIPVHELENLYCHLSELGYRISKDKAIDGAKAIAMANSFNPVREYLDRIAADDSITTVDLGRVGSDYWDIEDDLYNAMIAKTLIAGVKRIYEPGCMHRTCIVFKGGQDIGKSTSIRILAGPDWINDTAQDKHQDFLLSAHSCWINELAELDSITSKKDAGTLKNILSSPKDCIRVPYGKAHDTFPRSSIFWGTCNRSDFLRDETGHSRFWVVELPHNADAGKRINLDKIRQDRDAIWRAAVLAYLRGEGTTLTTEQQAESNRRNRRYEQDHPWEEYIASWIDDLEQTLPHIKEFTSEQALNLSGAIGEYGSAAGWDHRFPALKQKDAVEVGRILRRLGFECDKHPVRRGGQRRRFWRRPGTGGTGN